jgi:hypothetical protein
VIRAVRREDGRLAKYPVASRWVNVQRLARKNGWALSSVPLGLDRTIYGLQAYGELDLEPETDGEGDQIKNRTFQVVGSCRVRPDNFGADNAFAFSETSGCRVSVYTRVWVNVCSILLKEEELLTFAIYGVGFCRV